MKNLKNSIVIHTHYTTTADDYYIGVDIEKSITITLLPNAEDGQEHIIKLQMQPPMFNRIVKIVTSDDSTIDGYSAHTMSVSHDSFRLFRSGGNWYVV